MSSLPSVELIPRPDQYALEPLADGVRIVRRWFDPNMLGLLAFAVAWDGFLVLWYAALLSGGADLNRWVFFSFPLLHVAVGVGLTWTALRGLFNRSVITATRAGGVRIEHGPFPAGRVKTLRPGELRQLTCVKGGGRRRGVPGYDLVASTPRRRLKLLTGRPLAELRWVEREIESALGIVDEPANAVVPAAEAPAAGPAPEQPATQLRGGVRAQATPHGLVLSWRWPPFTGVALLGFTALALGAELPGALTTAWRGIGARGADFPPDTVPFVIAMIELTLAAAAAYAATALLVNRTYVTVARGGTLAVRHGPLPIRPGMTLPAEDIAQLFVREIVSRDEDSVSRRYRLLALLRSGRTVTLARTLDGRQAREVERQAERWLGIQNLPVAGAWPASDG